MPVNDYVCSKCKHFEGDVYEPKLNAPPPPCPECLLSSIIVPMDKVIGCPTFITRGDGFDTQGCH